jgi:hypothetical protein
MRLKLGEKGGRRMRVVVVAAVLVAAATFGGRELLQPVSGTGGVSNAPRALEPSSAGGSDGNLRNPSSVPSSQSLSPLPSGSAAASRPASSRPASSSAASSKAAPPVGSSKAASPSTSASPATLSATPVEPVGPDIVRDATVQLRVGKDSVAKQMDAISRLAADAGGYVNSSSLTGGSPTSEPTSGQVVVLVESADFTNTIGELSSLGRVTSEQVSGQDVTGQIAENAATISVLQQEVNLLQSKLSQATDISTFLQIEGQLGPVQQQLQQLVSQQSVLQNSVTFSTITVDLAAPGAPVPVTPATPNAARSKAPANALSVAWHYASHNTLVVLDGLAVAAGWALPLLVLGAGGWFLVTRLLRRRRPQGASA